MPEQEDRRLRVVTSVQYEAMPCTPPGKPTLRRLGAVHIGECNLSLCKCLISPSLTKERLIICTIGLLISRAWENKSDVETSGF